MKPEKLITALRSKLDAEIVESYSKKERSVNIKVDKTTMAELLSCISF